MFTGIVEEMGIVEKIDRGTLMHLIIRADKVLSKTKIGDSINVNGICLTAVNLDKKRVAFDVMKETQEKANLKLLKVGERVNLERAMSANARFGGHIISGHIDGVGIVRKRIKGSDEFWLHIEAEKNLTAFLVDKGSIAIDGVSLSVVEVKKNSFSVALIPHTLKSTTLGFKQENNKVNLEVDMLSKYVFRYFEKQKDSKPKLSKEYLKKMGYIE
ncbi:MAG: riboflavin synthase [Candidatus Omnitrophica bacterium]|nr:riboflavin synthase [Candidatus Omnitrophota bacterium]